MADHPIRRIWELLPRNLAPNRSLGMEPKAWRFIKSKGIILVLGGGRTPKGRSPADFEGIGTSYAGIRWIASERSRRVFGECRIAANSVPDERPYLRPNRGRYSVPQGRCVYPNFNRPPPFGAADGEEPLRSSVSHRDFRHCLSHSRELCTAVRHGHFLCAKLAAEL